MNRLLALAALALIVSLPGCNAAPGTLAVDPGVVGRRVLVNTDRTGVALQGYDPVAYFTDMKPVMGSSRFRSVHGGAVYWFASADHKARFDANPAMYEPQFGGYCGYAASVNRLSPVSPEFWEVIDGRLVLQHNQKAWDLWHQDVAGNLAKADANWPGLVDANGVMGKRLINAQDGVGIMGYDPVAYFHPGTPAKGDPAITAQYNGVTYRFTSQDHRATFEMNPAKYVPAFGGYCGYAASINKVSPVNPEIWQIIDGRLVLQHTPRAYELFNQDAGGNLARADKNWPGLVQRRGR
jgi:YHS domain-containing protein